MNIDPIKTDAKFPGDDLSRLVRRRKSVDLAFAMLGLALACASLTMLVVLFGQLVGDGGSRLFSGHEVKPDGFGPGHRDLVGRLEHDQRDAEGRWLLARDLYKPTNITLIAIPEKLEKLEGQTVIIRGDVPQPGHLEMEISDVELADTSGLPTFDRESIHGQLIRRDGQWMVNPSPLPIDVSELPERAVALAGQRVVVEIGMSKSLPLRARAIEPLIHQSFFGSMPSREASRAGIKSALVGSVLVVLVSMILAVPLGVAAGVYLEEYGRKNWLTAVIEINIANLAGVPSIVWGLMSLGLLVYAFGLGRSIQTAGITLGFLVLPIVIISTREAIRTIPQHIREASYACGASKWQTVRYHVLPYSMGGVLTGSIIGLSRAIGETAPLITIGALTYVAFLPDFSWSQPFAWLESGFTVLPIQMFNWVSRPDLSFQTNAAAAGIVLMVLTLCMNAAAIVLRYRLRKRIQW